jgi:hypothetical protein
MIDSNIVILKLRDAYRIQSCDLLCGLEVLRNVQYGGLEAPGCLSYPVVRPSVRSRDHLRT